MAILVADAVLHGGTDARSCPDLGELCPHPLDVFWVDELELDGPHNLLRRVTPGSFDRRAREAQRAVGVAHLYDVRGVAREREEPLLGAPAQLGCPALFGRI